MTKPAVVWMPGDVRTEVHVTAAESGGAFCMLVDESPAGWSLPPHRHAAESETIHVLEGRFDMEIDGRHTTMTAGDTAHVPAGVVHSGGNAGTETGRRVVIFSPGGIEGFWLEIGRPQPGTEFDVGEIVAAAQRWGWDFSRG